MQLDSSFPKNFEQKAKVILKHADNISKSKNRKRKTKMFSVLIKLGNEEMKTPEAIANELQTIVNRLNNGETLGFIKDGNGNTVGQWVYDEFNLLD